MLNSKLLLFAAVLLATFFAYAEKVDARSFTTEACHPSDGSKKTDKEVITEAIRLGKEEASNSVVNVEQSYKGNFTEVLREDRQSEILKKRIMRSNVTSNNIVRELSPPKGEWVVSFGVSCYRVTQDLEVTAREITVSRDEDLDAPDRSLEVQLWTGHARADEIAHYRVGDEFSFSIKGNKNFYARIYYEDSSGDLNQLVPSQLVKGDFFIGGIVHQLPQDHKNPSCNAFGCDKNNPDVLAMGYPLGQARLYLLASEKSLEGVDLERLGLVGELKTMKTRNLPARRASVLASSEDAEFDQSQLAISKVEIVVTE